MFRDRLRTEESIEVWEKSSFSFGSFCLPGRGWALRLALFLSACSTTKKPHCRVQRRVWVFGFTTTIVWVLEYKAVTHDLYELIPGLIVGFGVTWLVSLATYKNPNR